MNRPPHEAANARRSPFVLRLSKHERTGLEAANARRAPFVLRLSKYERTGLEAANARRTPLVPRLSKYERTGLEAANASPRTDLGLTCPTMVPRGRLPAKPRTAYVNHPSNEATGPA